MKKVYVEFKTQHHYEFDESDPAFENVSDDEITKLVRMMMFTDVFQATKEEDIFPLIQVTICD